MWLVMCGVLAAAAVAPLSADRSKLPPPCDNQIYCHGPLLDTVQMAGLYNDSKTFVDMKIRRSPNETMEEFYIMMNRTGSRPSKADVQEFVDGNFEPEGSEFEEWRPTDWKDNPDFLHKIKDPLLHQWASDLNRLWLQLGRKMKPEVKMHQDLYSIIYVDNPVIVPGGRFREFYYWDSYWIIRGLLLSEMRGTARGMLSNFLDIVERIGFIPNGGRIYYAMRSQPPLLIPMMKSILDDRGDRAFLRRHLPTLEKEFDFWMTNHTVEVEHNGRRFKLARYVDQSQGPRPESYKEDIDCAKHFESQEMKEELYAELKSAAESGWDFSSRWFILNGTNKGNLTNLKTRSIIPVDLNAIMCWNAQLLADFSRELGDDAREKHYRDLWHDYRDAIDQVLWHEDTGAWLDHSLESGRPRDYFYPSNVAPLWTGCYDAARKDYYVSRVINYLDKVKVDIFDGGIPTTFEHSGEQWDYPNAWPPLQYIVVAGLAGTQAPAAERLAQEMAAKWVRSNYEVWRRKTAMLEKYDATIFGGTGGGGEYVLQTGFGWTNGVIMELLDKYGERMSAADAFGGSGGGAGAEAGAGAVRAGAGAGGVAAALLVVLASVAAGALGYIFTFSMLKSACELALINLAVYRKRQHYAVLSPNESVKLLSNKPYTELRSMNGAGHARQR